MDEEKKYRKFLRHYFSQTGWILLVFMIMLNLTVPIAALAEATWRAVHDQVDFMEATMQSMMNNAWGYLAAIALGAGTILLWKGWDFCGRQIWQAERSMHGTDFFGLAGAIVLGQILFQFLAGALESLLNLMGLTAMMAIESATMVSDSFSMFLYACLVAPIWEEFLFRGLLMRTLMPGGKKFAILTSAFLFGMFHGNVVQTPFTFIIGLVLGYTAAEFGLGWAMALHMFNNLILSDVLFRLSLLLPEWAGELLNMGVMGILAVTGVAVALAKRQQFRRFRQTGIMSRRNLKCFFSAPGILIFIAAMVISMIATIQPL